MAHTVHRAIREALEDLPAAVPPPLRSDRTIYDVQIRLNDRVIIKGALTREELDEYVGLPCMIELDQLRRAVGYLQQDPNGGMYVSVLHDTLGRADVQLFNDARRHGLIPARNAGGECRLYLDDMNSVTLWSDEGRRPARTYLGRYAELGLNRLTPEEIPVHSYQEIAGRGAQSEPPSAPG